MFAIRAKCGKFKTFGHNAKTVARVDSSYSRSDGVVSGATDAGPGTLAGSRPMSSHINRCAPSRETIPDAVSLTKSLALYTFPRGLSTGSFSKTTFGTVKPSTFPSIELP